MANGPLNKLRVMVDANVLVAGSLWPRLPYEVLEHAVNGDFQLVLTPQIITEAREAAAEISPMRGARLEGVLKASAYEEIPTPTEDEIAADAGLIRDPKDVHVALAAIAGKVDFLITQDKDFTEHTEQTEVLHQKINIILPGTFLREYMGWTSEALEAIRKRTWAELETENRDE
ncbi:MAG: hypothetical protein BroJett018_40270 [Chloroflexota bacterium]|nr:MAG: hypothetical protein BroJett018_40270 [Chloroflexota bacterium]